MSAIRSLCAEARALNAGNSLLLELVDAAEAELQELERLKALWELESGRAQKAEGELFMEGAKLAERDRADAELLEAWHTYTAAGSAEECLEEMFRRWADAKGGGK